MYVSADSSTPCNDIIDAPGLIASKPVGDIIISQLQWIIVAC